MVISSLAWGALKLTSSLVSAGFRKLLGMAEDAALVEWSGDVVLKAREKSHQVSRGLSQGLALGSRALGAHQREVSRAGVARPMAPTAERIRSETQFDSVVVVAVTFRLSITGPVLNESKGANSRCCVYYYCCTNILPRLRGSYRLRGPCPCAARARAAVSPRQTNRIPPRACRISNPCSLVRLPVAYSFAISPPVDLVSPRGLRLPVAVGRAGLARVGSRSGRRRSCGSEGRSSRLSRSHARILSWTRQSYRCPLSGQPGFHSYVHRICAACPARA